jgi:AcrR family transcriptional regulator
MNRRSADETRRKINDAALRVFSASGFENSNMRMIAGEAGISVGALYLYYKSKDELCSTVFKGLFDDFLKQIDEKVNPVTDPASQIRTYISVYTTMAKFHREFIYSFNREKGFAYGVDWKQKFFARLRSIIDAIIKKGIDSGVFGDINMDEATKILMSVLRGYVVSIVIDPENLFDPDACADILLNGLIKRSGGGKVTSNEED